MHATEEYVWQALRAGACGYLLKDSGLSELELAINAVMKGEMYLTPTVNKKVVMDYMERLDTDQHPHRTTYPPSKGNFTAHCRGKYR